MTCYKKCKVEAIRYPVYQSSKIRQKLKTKMTAKGLQSYVIKSAKDIKNLNGLKIVSVGQSFISNDKSGN